MPDIEWETLNLDDCAIRVARGGAGAPLLFLPDAWIGAAWLPFHDRLAERFEVILPEHPGYGGGDAPPWLDRIPDLANFYLDLIERRELGGVHLVGASLGGWIAAELATRDASRLASLSLIAPWGLRVARVQGIDPFAANDEQVLRDLFFDPQVGAAALARVLAPEAEDALLKGKTVTAMLAWQPRLHDPQLQKWLHRIAVPTLILWGAEDRLLPREYGAAWQRAIPGARLVALPDCGHLPHLERPRELADLVTDFIAPGRVAA